MVSRDVPTLVSGLFEVKGRFLRSTHLERDFRDATALDGYAVTQQVRSNVRRLAEGLAPNSGRRAWRITGDYGTGKSSFALALAHLFAGQAPVSLPSPLEELAEFAGLNTPPNLLPVLVTGSPEPLSVALLRGLRNALHRATDLDMRFFGSLLLSEIDEVLTDVETNTERGLRTADDNVMRFIETAAKDVRKSGIANGVLIIVDEMGKFLEYAATHPEQQDVYLLQRLAEYATRSGDTPVFVMSLLHQGFHAYTQQLALTSQKEWEKVAGRFEEVIFAQPAEQAAELIAHALGVQTSRLPESLRLQARQDMSRALDLGWYGAGVVRERLLDLAEAVYPLHPTVIPVLIRLFSAFGQNERSLFSFLLSSEPFGLQSFAERPVAEAGFFRISDVYDYARATFGHKLAVQSYRSHWNHIDGVVESFPAENELEQRVLKTVGLLNLLDTQALLPTLDALSLAAGTGETIEHQSYNDKANDGVVQALEKLQRGKRAIYYRGASGGYCLWPYTSVNLDRVYDEARRTVGSVDRVIPLLISQLADQAPIIARRHYVETGNLRHFSVMYGTLGDVAAATSLPGSLAGGKAAPDGHIFIILCENEQERNEAVNFVQSDTLSQRPDVLVAVSKPLHGLAGLVQEVQCWEWIQAHTTELMHDSYAAEEVSRRIEASHYTLHTRVRGRIGIQHALGTTFELAWFKQGRYESIRDSRELLSRLSDICDSLYPEAPLVRNELVNRRYLSTAAAAARMRLIERMFSDGNLPFLGMDPTKRPPEFSMYLSVVEAAGIHHVQENGEWVVSEPSGSQENDPCRVRPAFQYLYNYLTEKLDQRVSVNDLMSMLRRPPLGVRDGLIPLLLTAFLLTHRHEVALYEDDAFLRRVGSDELMRLIKAPDTFEMQLCRVAGVRSGLFSQLSQVLGSNIRGGGEVEGSVGQTQILDIVMPLCKFAAELPEYSMNTERLSSVTQAVRLALKQARDPGSLLFTELPIACGLEPIQPDSPQENELTAQFVGVLSTTIEDLRNSYHDLQTRIFHDLRRSLTLPETSNISDVQQQIAARAQNVLIIVREPRLKTFCGRLADTGLAPADWIISIASFVVSKPPARWRDMDSDRFVIELTELSRRFTRMESMIFPPQGQDEAASAVRMSVMKQDGSELEKVLFLTPDEEQAAAELGGRLADLVPPGDRVGLAAMARVLWERLEMNT